MVVYNATYRFDYEKSDTAWITYYLMYTLYKFQVGIKHIHIDTDYDGEMILTIEKIFSPRLLIAPE